MLRSKLLKGFGGGGGASKSLGLKLFGIIFSIVVKTPKPGKHVKY